MLWLMPADLRRQRIGMMFISIDPSACAARSAAAADTTRTDCRRLVHGRQMSGGKGAKGGNLESAGKTGPADDVAKRLKPAETGGNSILEPYSGGKVFLEGLRETPNSVAEIAENAESPTAAARPGTRARALSLRRVRDHLAHHRRQRPFGHAVDRAPARAGRQLGESIGRGGGARHGELEMEMRKSVAHQPVEDLPARRHRC